MQMNEPLNTPVPAPGSAELDAHWMPFTGNRDFKAHPRWITGASGAYYTTPMAARSSTACRPVVITDCP